MLLSFFKTKYVADDIVKFAGNWHVHEENCCSLWCSKEEGFIQQSLPADDMINKNKCGNWQATARCRWTLEPKFSNVSDVHHQDGRITWLRPRVLDGCKPLTTEATGGPWGTKLSSWRFTADNYDDDDDDEEKIGGQGRNYTIWGAWQILLMGSYQ